MLPWSFCEVNSHGRGPRGQHGIGIGHGSGRGPKRSCFNEYVFLPSSSVPTTHERMKFASVPSGSLLTSRKTIFADEDEES
jgi:hypothetical protein